MNDIQIHTETPIGVPIDKVMCTSCFGFGKGSVILLVLGGIHFYLCEDCAKELIEKLDVIKCDL